MIFFYTTIRDVKVEIAAEGFVDDRNVGLGRYYRFISASTLDGEPFELSDQDIRDLNREIVYERVLGELS